MRAYQILAFSFPKDPERREKWRQFVGRGDSWKPSAYTRLCSKHFSQECFDLSSQILVRLKSNAVPTLNSPYSHPPFHSKQVLFYVSNILQ